MSGATGTGGGTGETPTLDPETLLEEAALDTVEGVVDGTVPGPLAVVGDPFAGREAVLDRVADRLDATRVRLGPETGVGVVEEALDSDGGPLVVDGCQHLYTRTVGGFEDLERCLDLLAGVEGPVVTGWNRYAWSYLAAVRDVDGDIPERVEVGPVAAEALAELLLARYEEMPEFAGEDGPGRLVTVRRVTVAGVEVPLPAVDRAALAALGEDEPDPRDIVFERLAAVSEGNVGVAVALWERLRGSQVRPGDIVGPDASSLDRETAFCLRVVLAKERVSRAELAAVVGTDVERVLGRLRRAELVSEEGGVVALNPAALPTAVAETERERIL